MAFETTTPNMSLSVPSVGNTLSPTWATDLNADLSIIDGHNHTAGSGVPIPAGGISLNSDLPFNNNNATLLRSVRFLSQGSLLAGVSDLGCLYESGVDLYYNDGSGNQIRITQSGGIAGTPGSIANLTPPASASYVSLSQTFVWQSDANTPANLDAGFIILRNNVVNSKGLTLSPPSAMASNFSITLPTLPSVTNIMTLDSSGNMGASLNVDNVTLQIASNVLSIKNGGVGPNQLAALNSVLSSSAGTFSDSNNPTPTQFPNLSVSITTSGRPVRIELQDGLSGSSLQWLTDSGAVRFKRDATFINFMSIATTDLTQSISVPASSFSFVDFGAAAGTYTYSAYYLIPSGFLNSTNGPKLLVYEM